MTKTIEQLLNEATSIIAEDKKVPLMSSAQEVPSENIIVAEEPITSDAQQVEGYSSDAVIELLGGTCKKNNINEGLIYRHF